MQPISSESRKYIVEQYQLGAGTNELSLELGIHRATVQRVLKGAGVTLRKKTPTHKHNVLFFDFYSPSSCYWAGFLMADGCSLSKRATISVHLSAEDRDQLERLARCVGFTGKIEDCKDGSCRLAINGPWYPHALKKNYGLNPRKTLTCEYPSELPPEMDKHFIRGLLDGDGSVCMTAAPTVSFVGAKPLMETVSRRCAETLSLTLKSGNLWAPVGSTPNPAIGTVSYSGENARRILEWLYEDLPEDCWMPRKREAFGYLFS